MKSAGEIIGKSTFFKNYEDDRWKDFSGRVRDFHGNVCMSCKATDKITQVHHWKYYPGRMPWEYELGEVVVLCSHCHALFHVHLQQFRRFIFPRVTPQAFAALNGALAIGLGENDGLSLMYAIAELVSSPGLVVRFSKAWVAQGRGKKAQVMQEAMKLEQIETPPLQPA